MPAAAPLALSVCLYAAHVLICAGCPHEAEDAKAAYKSGEMFDMNTPVTLAVIKRKLKESGLFDPDRESFSDKERKELAKLFEAVEIMTTSRNRQPANVQNVFSSLRIVERAVKKLLKEGQISDSLADKFHWDRLNNMISTPIAAPPEQIPSAPEKSIYFLDKDTNMRVFNTM